MNNFQKERDELLSKKGLSAEQKRAVIEAVHTKTPRNKKWMPAVAVAGVLAAGLFLMMIEQSEEQPVTSKIEQVQASGSFAESYEKEWQSHASEVLYEGHRVRSNNDEFLILKEDKEGEIVYQFVFGYFNAEQQRWKVDERMSLYDKYPTKATIFPLAGANMKIGIVQNDQVEAIYVGDEQATIVESNAGQRVWFAFAARPETPVYESIAGQKSRIMNLNSRVNSVVPIIEPVASSLQTIHYKKDTMHRGNEEYTKFPIVLDPYYYAQEAYAVGDVIAYEKDGELEVSRILATNEGKLRLVDDTLVNGDYIQELDGTFYTWPTYAGDNAIYKGLSKDYKKVHPDELLVIPDNWASDGYQGIIKKEQLVGKVVGYDLTQLTNTLTVDELTLFEQLQRSRTTIDSLVKDVSVNTVVRLYLYANYVDDYELMYALLEKSADVPAFEQWQQRVEKTSKYHLLKDIYEMGFAQLTKDQSKLRFTDPVSENILRQYKVIKTAQGWKVVYANN